jgi:hypothetical protein
MKFKFLKRIFIALLSFSLMAAISMASGSSDYTVLNDNSYQLKEQFNKDHGHIRLLMLVSPT